MSDLKERLDNIEDEIKEIRKELEKPNPIIETLVDMGIPIDDIVRISDFKYMVRNGKSLFDILSNGVSWSLDIKRLATLSVSSLIVDPKSNYIIDLEK